MQSFWFNKVNHVGDLFVEMFVLQENGSHGKDLYPMLLVVEDYFFDEQIYEFFHVQFPAMLMKYAPKIDKNVFYFHKYFTNKTVDGTTACMLETTLVTIDFNSKSNVITNIYHSGKPFDFYTIKNICSSATTVLMYF